jgi:hypothetical protein
VVYIFPSPPFYCCCYRFQGHYFSFDVFCGAQSPLFLAHTPAGDCPLSLSVLQRLVAGLPVQVSTKDAFLVLRFVDQLFPRGAVAILLRRGLNKLPIFMNYFRIKFISFVALGLVSRIACQRKQAPLSIVSHTGWVPPAPYLKLAGQSTAALHSLPPPRLSYNHPARINGKHVSRVIKNACLPCHCLARDLLLFHLLL